MPQAACMFRVTKDKKTSYYVLADEDNEVVGSTSDVAMLAAFENQHRGAFAHGWNTLAAGATVRFIMLSPRVFSFRTLGELKKICGAKPYPVVLSGEGFFPCTGIYCSNTRLAAKVYSKAKTPRLVP
jgi:hypothetical protein